MEVPNLPHSSTSWSYNPNTKQLKNQSQQHGYAPTAGQHNTMQPFPAGARNTGALQERQLNTYGNQHNHQQYAQAAPGSGWGQWQAPPGQAPALEPNNAYAQQLMYAEQQRQQQGQQQQQHQGHQEAGMVSVQEPLYSAPSAALAMAHVPPSADIPKLQSKISDLRTALQLSDETCTGLRQQVSSARIIQAAII